MSKIKKTFAALMVTATLLGTIPTQKAEAGIVLIASGIKYNSGILLGVVLTVWGLNTHSNLLIVLDSENPGESLADKLAIQFPEIDNQISLNALADKILSKANLSEANNGKVEVRLSKEEVAEALEASDLSSTQLNNIAQTLN